MVKLLAIPTLIAAALMMSPLCASPSLAATTATSTAPTRDGHKDFGFLFGTWRTHYEILPHRMRNSHEWYGCDGTAIIYPFWGGSGNLEDGDLHCPKRTIGGMTLRMYNATTHQWSLYWGTRKLGLVPPPQIGHFDANGVGDFYSNDTASNLGLPSAYAGKPIIVRFRWTLRSGNHPHFEQAFSADNGKTWETNWTTVYTRVAPSTKGVWNATQ